MTNRTVTTKMELRKAYKDKVDIITVKGKLAKKINKANKILKDTNTPLNPASAALNIPLTIVAAAIGLALLIAVLKDYDEVGFKIVDFAEIKLIKKSKE